MLILQWPMLVFARRTELWFEEGPGRHHSSYTIFIYGREKKNNYDACFTEQTTVLDLAKDMPELERNLHTGTRYEIKKAEQLNLDWKMSDCPTLSECKTMLIAYQAFARKKNISAMHRKRILNVCKSGNLCISVSSTKHGVLNTHVYLCDNQNALLLYSLPGGKNQDRDTELYANKFHHWKDVAYFKNMGFSRYDFGGINLEKLPGISNFKLSFGGKTETVYSYIYIHPAYRLWYKLYLKLLGR